MHGVPRVTFDLDILIEKSINNAERLLNALAESGFGTASMTSPKDIVSHEITIFADRVRIDVQSFTPGIDFESAWDHKLAMNYDGQTFYIVSKSDLILSKRASARKIDVEDVRLLELE